MTPNAGPGLSVEAVDFDPFAEALARVHGSTEAQREIWLADKLSREASLAYNESITIRLQGDANIDALRAALQDVVARHEALRSTIGATGEEVYVSQDLLLDIPLLAGGESTLAEARKRAVETPFDLEKGPLVRAEIVELSPTDHAIVFAAHHIVCDGWSFGVIVQDLGRFYAARVQDTPLAIDAAETYGDYAAMEALLPGTEEYEADVAYWVAQYRGSLPTLELPTDRPRRAFRTFTAGRVDHVFDAQLVAAIRKLGSQSGASLVATLVGSFAGLLQRLTAADDVVVGITAAGQSTSGRYELVGHCVNLLPLRFAVDANTPINALIATSRTTVLDAFEHYRVTLGALLQKLAFQRDASRLTLVSVLFNIDQEIDKGGSTFGALQSEVYSNPRAFENFELFINAVPTQGALRLECQYNTDLFDAATVRRWLASFETMLRTAVQQPSTPIGRLPLVTEADLQAVKQLNATTEASYPRDALVHELVAEQADRDPYRIALHFEGQNISYGELTTKAHQLAHALRARGVRQGVRVGLCLERGPDLIVSLLAVLEAGGAYVPLDPAYPPQRLAFCVNDADIAVLLTQVSLKDLIDYPDDRKLLIDAGSDAGATALASMPSTLLPRDAQSATPQSAAYVIYTSGSTGNPKGVQVPHSAVVNFINSMRVEPGLSADDRLLAVTTLAFDIAVLELLVPLSVGARVLLASRDNAVNGDALRDMLAEHKATVMQATPASWRLLIESGWKGNRTFKALCGGEALPPDLARQLLERTGELWNMYGPTETTVWSTCWRVENPSAGISIGRPIANTSIWILDENQQPCPIGVPGELYIGGDGVAIGYLNRPELTAEKFVSDPFSAQPGARLYRTGDRARWRNDGRLEHLGRIDFQVKVRGFRIELGEIEANLAQHPDVARALAIVREDRADDVRLVAYVVSRNGRKIESRTLRDHLRQMLPEYMVPQHFVDLASLPLLPNGKVDRKALPPPSTEPTGSLLRDVVAPRNDTEKAVVAAMESVLGLPGIGVTDGFFVLGGHSLLAAQLTTRLNRDFGTRLSLRSVFETPTAEGLAEALTKAKQQTGGAATAAAPIQHLRDQHRAPASLMQQRLWFLEELNPGRVVYNTPSAHRLTGPLNEAAFDKALREVVRRQGSLRTTLAQISSADGSQIEQRIHDSVEFSLFPIVDLSAVPADDRERELLARLDVITNQPFDLTVAPLFRVKLFRLASQEHVFFFMPHHAIWDGWSFDIFYAEMAQLYAGYAAGESPSLPELPVSYADFSAWQLDWTHSEEFSTQTQFWRNRLTTAGEVRALPTDRPRRPGMSGEGCTEWLKVGKEKTDALRELSREANTTLFMTLLAVYYLLLYRSTGQKRLVIGTPVRGRSVTDVEQVMGYFTNLLPLHLEVDPQEPFPDFVRRVKNVVLDSFTYPDVSLEQLSRELVTQRGESNSLLYQALFSFQDARQRPATWGALAHEQVLVFQRGATEDLGLWFLDHGHGMVGGVTYNADIINASTAQLLRERYLALLDSILSHADAPVGELALGGDADAAKIARWNHTERALTGPALIHQIFEAQADADLKRAALFTGGWSVTYGDIEQQSNRIANVLLARGIKPGATVGLCEEPGQAFFSALLGTLKAGAAILVLDPFGSRAHALSVLRTSGARLLIANSRSADLAQATSIDLLGLDTAADEIAAASPTRPVATSVPGNQQVAAQVALMGVGATPRLVALTHATLRNTLLSLSEKLSLAATDRCLAVSPISAESSLVEWLLPWTQGGALIVGKPESARDVTALRAEIESNNVTLVTLPADTWQALFDAGWQSTDALTGLVSGDRLTAELCERLGASPGKFWRVSGWAEAGIWTTTHRITRPEDAPIVGAPLDNTSVWITDDSNHPSAVGVFGAIRIAGNAHAGGYSPPARGRWRSDGTLEVVVDDTREAMLEGKRINLAACAARVAKTLGANDVLVVPRDIARNDRRLVVYLAGAAAQKPRDEALRVIAEAIPAMVEVVTLTEIPHGVDGRVDYRALPLPEIQAGHAQAAGSFVELSTPTEKTLAAIWQELLGVPRVSARDNFFDLGGHSLMAMQVMTKMEQLTSKRIPPRLFLFEDLAHIAKTYDEAVVESKPKAGLLKRLFGRS